MIDLIVLAMAVVGQASNPTPLNARDWIAADDYPRSAAFLKQSGVVVARLSVDSTGKVIKCDITQSSAVAILDNTTCALISARAQFSPARDQDGNPIKGTYSQLVTWENPTPPAPIAYSWVAVNDYPSIALRNRWQGDSYFSVTITAEGRAENCIIIQSSGYKELDDTTCNLVLRRARFTVAKDSSGKAAAGHFNSAVRWRIPRG